MQGGNENPSAESTQGGGDSPGEEQQGKEPVGVDPDRQGDEPTDAQLGGPGSKEEADAEADVQQSGP
jgi:hypothetical protein